MNEKDVVSSLQNLVAMEIRYPNQFMHVFRHHQRIHQDAGQVRDADVEAGQPRYSNINADGDVLSYAPNNRFSVGLYVAGEPLTPEDYYFEVEILDIGNRGTIGVGLVPQRYPLDAQPGWRAFSVGFHADDGKLYKANGFGKPFGSKSQTGDRIGCGIKFSAPEEGPGQSVKVFFTHNGKEVGMMMMQTPARGLYPAVGMHSTGEEVRLNLEAEWLYEDLVLMAVDNGEDDWSRLHDVRLNGTTLEYMGRGKSIHDVGLAQARWPLDTTYHYFEIEIIDPGENCYIAIGVARRNYPHHRHPGWNKGSIAYHADDGKIFVGSGVGDPFGPRCHKGDIMGCGILFPPDYDGETDSDLSPDDPDVHNDMVDDFSDDSDEDDIIPGGRVLDQNGTKVWIFFTRNGKIIGKKQVPIPKGGFFPTVGMLSSCEKVRIDLRPLTG
ncbi:SPRY domain-containing protein 3-like isoform X1 [Mizuhopecten yessoensis]|uniref:SPRY domain-containing protein 3 n=1 Tax=Mizuhopecten yessoensis TaxID=6573 RepID=A0A210PIR1_MIZYE|nr:SPRY domain-containing protein 3-like isoform X1 [Mizuhopecten yessoensis]OWF36364.1 SPRY domain-containing protein 3 [Mizuhopecten yessoensis]